MNYKKEKPQVNCEIVRDLLPLYHDGVVSEVTKTVISEHLEHCDSCRKENDLLSADLPIEGSAPSTKSRFMDMMCRQKKKRIWMTVIAVIVVCMLLAAAYFIQMQIPIAKVPDEEITVHRVYQYKTDRGYKFFVLYSMPYYDYTVMDAFVKEGEHSDTLVLNVKKPLTASKHTGAEKNDRVFIYECGSWSGDNRTVFLDDFDQVEFGGKVVWSQAVNKNEEIPEYVYAYEAFNEQTANISSWFVSSDEGYLGVGYSDGGRTLWNFDGDVLYNDNQD